MNNSQLAQSLHAPLQKSYLIHGDEELLRIEAVDMLRAAGQQQGYRQRTVYTAEGSHFDWNAVLAETQSMGLFSEQKWLEIHIPSGKPGKNGGDALCELAERLPDAMVLVLVLPKLSSKANGSARFPDWAPWSKHSRLRGTRCLHGYANACGSTDWTLKATR